MSDFKTEKNNLLWSTQLSVRYHNHRIRFYDGIHMLSTFIMILLGSGTVIFALKNMDTVLVMFAGLLVTFFSTLDLMWGTTKKSRFHYDLSKRFINLEREIIRIEDGDLAQITDQRLLIEMEEPPVLRVLYDYCYNEMLQMKGTEEGNILKFKWYHRLTKDFTDFFPDKIKIDSNWKSSRTPVAGINLATF